ncbi:class I adenylate-forming enzyme family protein [Sciscionella marina]|uniref:class I adenylate-forming enzyme family protein n=1 Tax=Sciscionella marina TaxID=508770 RepID=UPI00035EA8A5|nr:AMP-binding protein [Sciscionella marina]
MTTIAGLVRSNARRVPEREALVFGPGRLSWRELDLRVDAAAAVLAEHGLRHGDRCGLMAANSDEYLVAAYAVLRLGAVLVPVNTRLAVPEIAFIVNDCGARLLVHDSGSREKAFAAMGELSAAAIGLGELRSCRRARAAELGEDVRESDDALILYTSGTTGKPKGVLLDHHRAIWAGLAQLPLGGLSELDRYLHLTPLYHGSGITMSTAMLLVGGTQIVHERFEAGQALRTLESERVTVLLGVPTMYQLMLEHADVSRRDLGAWRIAFFGAAPMPASAVRRLLSVLPRVKLIQQAGQTEAGPAGIYATADQVHARPDATGVQAFPYFEARIVDEHDQDIGPGAVGELILRGESVMKGYWGLPEASATALRGGWLRTGDLVRVDVDGYLTIVDRLKDVIITGGRNVYSVEVENAIAAHPDVLDCAVLGQPHREYGETVVAVVAVRGDAGLTLDRIRSHCAELIADYKLPRELILAEIPRNAAGKVVKHELRALLGTE